jgi:hypothetical protein
MRFIDNSDDEKHQSVAHYDYILSASKLNVEQKEFLIEHFQDYDWEMGLAIKECDVFDEKENITFKFSSSKSFCLKPDGDSENNLLTRLVGKQQFFSNMFFSNLGFDGLHIIFTSSTGDNYKVEISKYGSLEILD